MNLDGATLIHRWAIITTTLGDLTYKYKRAVRLPEGELRPDRFLRVEVVTRGGELLVEHFGPGTVTHIREVTEAKARAFASNP